MEDLLALPPLDSEVGKHYELSDGELIVRGSAKPLHEWIKSQILELLVVYIVQNRIGKIFVESQFSLTATTARIPDIAFVRNEKLSGTVDLPTFAFAPDLAIEIISPSETYLAVKVADYLAAGVSEIWQVVPEMGTIVVRKQNGAHTLQADDILETPILPGFQVAVGAIFDFNR